MHDFELPRAQRKNKGYFGGPYIVFRDGQWHMYRNRWKSQFNGPKVWSARISAPTIRELREKISRGNDYSFNFERGVSSC